MQPLLDDARAGFSVDDLADALSLRRGATVRHGVDILTATGAPTRRLLPFELGSSSVSWDYRAPDPLAGQSEVAAAVRRTAQIVVPGPVSVSLASARLRVWTEWILPGSRWARFYLGVFVVTNPGALADDGTVQRRELRCADKSYLYQASTLVEPLYVPAGTIVVDYVRASLQSRFGETRFALASSTATLGLGLVFEAGTPWLEVYTRLLAAIGYDFTVNEVGDPAASPLADLASRGVEHVYGPGRGKVVEAGRVEPLAPTLPNVVRFSARQGPGTGSSDGNGLRIKRNVDTGPASINARGYEVELRVDVDADSQVVLDALADAEAQRYFAGGGLTFEGQVALNPRHSDRDVIGLDRPRLGLRGADPWWVTSWTYPLDDLSSERGALMPITAERKVTL